MSEISAKKLARRFLASRKNGPKNNVLFLLEDILLTQNHATIKPEGDGGAVATFPVGWLNFTIRMNKEGEYLLEASGSARGKIPYVPYEDHHEMASDLVHSDDDFFIFARLR